VAVSVAGAGVSSNLARIDMMVMGVNDCFVILRKKEKHTMKRTSKTDSQVPWKKKHWTARV
jgi:hypothetical protein